MSVILGSMTQVIVDGINSGFQSISWSVSRQPNRLWQLGDWLPWRTQVVTTISINLTAYAGVLPRLDQNRIRPSQACELSPASMHIILNASACQPADAIHLDQDHMYITSYSYSKTDPVGYGTESWSFQTWLASNVTGNEFINIPAPTYVLQGITEGQRSGDQTGIDRGIDLATEGLVIGQEGSVSAGPTSIGEASTIELGIVTRIGGGDLEAGGKVGTSSASIPHTPLYIQ